ncbi:MAG TPA: hypothetical protein VMW87_02980 [Spirochaetia bacterium]|nr:hypothetical protein [Spirochaetia bacterium]
MNGTDFFLGRLMVERTTELICAGRNARLTELSRTGNRGDVRESVGLWVLRLGASIAARNTTERRRYLREIERSICAGCSADA